MENRKEVILLMKQHQTLVILALTVAVAAIGGTAAAESPFKDALQVWTFADEAGLKKNGAVTLGVPLEGDEKTASLARGGDGRVAEFKDGCLVTDPGVKVTGKQMTLLMRARDASGQWTGTLLAAPNPGNPYPGLVYGTKLNLDRLGFRERARMKDGRAIEFRWQTDPLSEQVIPEFIGENSPHKEHNFKLRRFPPTLPVAAPVELIGATGWHDILVRFTGPKLELFIDGVLMDEEFPHGELRHFESPFVIGAGGVKSGKLLTGFHGQIDHLALWDRALTDAEVVALSGGTEQIARRRVEIEGEPVTLPQYWRPSGYNMFVGDPMLFFHDGTLHFFYLTDRKHGSQKWKCGGHVWGHASTRDLIHWEHHPRALDITDQTENALGTGQCLFENGKYYLYWINHGRRMLWKDSPEHRQADNVYLATSTDGIHFEKQSEPWIRLDYKYAFIDVNPFVWKAATGDRFYCYCPNFLGSRSNYQHSKRENYYFESTDLRRWTPTKLPTLDEISTDLVNYHRWNDWYYWFDWQSYWMSRTPAEDPATKFSSLKVLNGGVAAPFTGNRMLMAGFVGECGYAGRALFREAVQQPDGTLAVKWVPEMIPPTGEPMAAAIAPLRGAVTGDLAALRLDAGASPAIAELVSQMPRNVRITLRVVPEAGASGFGLCVRGHGDYASGRELCFEPDKKRFRFANAPDGAEVPRANAVPLPNLDRPFTLDVIVKDDFVDVCIDDKYTPFLFQPSDYARGDRLFFFVRKGAVRFETLSVRPLKEEGASVR